jgi:hypothetical protein
MACKLLLVVALGRLFLERGASSSGPLGIQEFLQGADLPSTLVLRQDPVITLETLFMLAIYAQEEKDWENPTQNDRNCPSSFALWLNFSLANQLTKIMKGTYNHAFDPPNF